MWDFRVLKFFCPLIVGLILLFASVSLAQEEMRTWSSASGRFTTRAKLQTVNDEKLTLVKADGTNITVALAQLSQADRDYVRDFLRKQSLSVEPAPDFQLDRWLMRYASEPVDISQWKKRSAGVHQDWFGGKNPKVAKSYFIHWGPLGIRTRMCDQTWGGEKAFRALWPEFLCDADGELLINCFEVVEVWPGSPAEGHLQPGDFLLAMDGQPFLPSMMVPTPTPYLFQEHRSLELHAGLLLDEAEGRGRVTFKVLRPPAWKTVKTTKQLSAAGKREAEIEVDVSNASAIRLVARSAHGNIDHGWVNWLRPTLIDVRGRSSDLSKTKPLSAKTGWGEIRRGRNAGDQPIKQNGKIIEDSIGAHMDSAIEFRIPAQVRKFKTTLQLGNDRFNGLEGRIEVLPRFMTNKVSSTWRTAVRKSFRKNRAPEQIEASLEGADRFRLVVTDGGDGINYDGFSWVGVHLRQGNRRLRLDELQVISKSTGYGQIKVDKSTGDWFTHANSVLEFAVPEGSWELRGAARPESSGNVDILVQVHQPLDDLPEELELHCRNVTFAIPKVGQFAKNFPAGCQKSTNTVDMMAAWLAKQQRKNGAWPRPDRAYTKPHYDTSWAALALMATGDQKFDANIRKAAEFVAFSGTHDAWAIPSGSALLFLSEYWLRYRDDRVLPAIEVWSRRITGEMVLGDQTSGHGHNPGYRGTGVSVGGAATVVALAVAEQTPAQVPEGLVAKMLARGQQLGPSGFLPYGRIAESQSFEPNLTSGGSYSGRHGPYLIASLIQGGPRLFTENCSAMYSRGPVGGIDQGHATQTLSLMWGLPAVANADVDAFHRHMEALKWKFTMLRSFDGGYLHNSYRLELQTGESLLDFAIRTACYTIALCAERKNLAITGALKKHAETSTFNVPPTSDQDAMVHRYYLTNWAVAEAVLGTEAPDRLSRGVKTLQQLRKGEGLRDRVFAFLKSNSLPVARDLLAMDSVDNTLRNYLAEMVLGIDHRISVNRSVEDNRADAGRYEIILASQHAGGPMQGEVLFEDPDRKFSKPVRFALEPLNDVDWKKWHTREQKVSVKGRASEPFDLNVRIRYQVAGLTFDYVRPIRVGNLEPWGNGEKQRTVVNDRRVWVPGTLIHDHSRWNLSFNLPSGIYVAAGTQGNSVKIDDQTGSTPKQWISPADRTLLAGSECEFCFTSGWQHFECRVPEVRLKQDGRPTIIPVSYKFEPPVQDAGSGLLADADKKTGFKIGFTKPGSMKTKNTFPTSMIEVEFRAPEVLEAVDLRLVPGSVPSNWSAPIKVYANVDGKWQTVYWGRFSEPGMLIRTVPIRTASVRVEISHPRRKEVGLGMLRFYGQVKK